MFLKIVMKKRSKCWGLIVALIPLIVCTVQLSVNEYTSKFNQNRWLNHADKRVHMVDDLLQKYKLKGKSNEEITQLLGAPTETRSGEKELSLCIILGLNVALSQ